MSGVGDTERKLSVNISNGTVGCSQLMDPSSYDRDIVVIDHDTGDDYGILCPHGDREGR